MTNHHPFIARSSLTVLAAALALADYANAAPYPERAVTWVVPFSAGGPADVLARNIAAKVAENLGQPIVIDNTGGAGGTIGAAKVAKSKNDGYTFLLGHVGQMAAAPYLYKKLPYDPIKDFEPVFRLPYTPLILLVGVNSPFKNVEQLIAAAKAKPGSINFGNAGVGSTSHLVAALFAQQAGINITSISYKGAGPAMVDVVSGRIDAMFDQSNSSLPQVTAGRARALAQSGAKRMPQFSAVPTVSESTIPHFAAVTWYGLYAPHGTPVAALATMNTAYRKAIGDSSLRDRLSKQGVQLLQDEEYSAAALKKLNADELVRWKDVITQTRITAE
ncbi:MULTISPECIES: Bug family tripartite tricarboxylate transporter substrate binding protein [unclassified Cupriavidus]|uniref:Bug family tripartite tricarboxylate transporter substrate binding protein n=1 Tax=unclassified Cupriavidus TaxID=2640874 RepID=UPI002270DBAD|nr:tripartite tricarboxylate transporter substrate-binding protein [Cupriavidus sp. D39]MCY0854946.1 tripartite tricarboxylate transporter substrate-binding protein [Cupriavidus sp. D39]